MLQFGGTKARSSDLFDNLNSLAGTTKKLIKGLKVWKFSRKEICCNQNFICIFAGSWKYLHPTRSSSSIAFGSTRERKIKGDFVSIYSVGATKYHRIQVCSHLQGGRVEGMGGINALGHFSSQKIYLKSVHLLKIFGGWLKKFLLEIWWMKINGRRRDG